ncbi:hypothetical protein ACWA7J_10445 [Leptothrix sp. BB-4]
MPNLSTAKKPVLAAARALARPRSMPVWMAVGLFGVVAHLIGAPAPAFAQGAPEVSAPTLWRCSLTASATRLLCVAERSPDAPAATETSAVRNASGVPARYPLDPSRPYTIELLGPATDMPLVTQLAQFTLCLKTPRCTAVVV